MWFTAPRPGLSRPDVALGRCGGTGLLPRVFHSGTVAVLPDVLPALLALAVKDCLGRVPTSRARQSLVLRERRLQVRPQSLNLSPQFRVFPFEERRALGAAPTVRRLVLRVRQRHMPSVLALT